MRISLESTAIVSRSSRRIARAPFPLRVGRVPGTRTGPDAGRTPAQETYYAQMNSPPFPGHDKSARRARSPTPEALLDSQGCP